MSVTHVPRLEERDVDGAMQEAAAKVDASTRASFLRKAGVGGAALVGGGILLGRPGAAFAGHLDPIPDVDILNYALTLEYSRRRSTRRRSAGPGQPGFPRAARPSTAARSPARTSSPASVGGFAAPHTATSRTFATTRSPMSTSCGALSAPPRSGHARSTSPRRSRASRRSSGPLRCSRTQASWPTTVRFGTSMTATPCRPAHKLPPSRRAMPRTSTS